MESFSTEDIRQRYCQGFFSDIDINFARLISDIGQDGGSVLFLTAALLSKHTGAGNVCFNVDAASAKPLTDDTDPGKRIICPKLEDWISALRASPVVGNPGELTPMVLDQSFRLYLHRYWEYEQQLAAAFKERASADEHDIDKPVLRDGLSRLFPPANEDEIDWQKFAGVTAVMKKLSVICGGPGTGKTTTIAKILVLLAEQRQGNIKIALAAPTGKAADRLQATMKRAKKDLMCRDDIKSAIPDGASTLHRLLGAVPGSSFFRHNPDNCLPADVVVVDETSMVDLPLMFKLIEALSPETKLVLLGDRDQLASIETGTVLGDICTRESIRCFSSQFVETFNNLTGEQIDLQHNDNEGSVLSDCIVGLTKNFRFGTESGIGSLSKEVRAGNGREAFNHLKSKQHQGISWSPLPGPEKLRTDLERVVLDRFRLYTKNFSPEEMFKELDHFRILCSVREGPYGVKAINAGVEKILVDHAMIQPAGQWYCGRQIMITVNDYSLGLFNGDVGLFLHDSESQNSIRAFFPGPDGSLRKFFPGRLPEHETVYAMTVHKAQGAEFDHVLVIVPDRPSPLLTRELIYTAITRARESVTVWGTEEIFKTAVANRIERSSGLRDALLG